MCGWDDQVCEGWDGQVCGGMSKCVCVGGGRGKCVCVGIGKCVWRGWVCNCLCVVCTYCMTMYIHICTWESLVHE